MGDLVEVVHEQVLDVDGSFNAYCRFRRRGGAANLETAFSHALPVVRMVCRSPNRELIAASAWGLFDALRRRRFKDGSPEQYAAFLRHVALGSFLSEYINIARFQVVSEIPPDAFDFWARMSGRLVGYDDVDRKMIIEKIPVIVAEHVTSRLRFEGEERDACLFVLRSVLEGVDVNPRGLADLFAIKQTRLRFLVDYVVVRVRLALQAIRRELRAATVSAAPSLERVSVTTWLYGEE